jgi:hypothetical protein
MLVHELCDFVQFPSTEASSALQRNRLQPEFRNHILASHVNMRWFASIQGYEEETVGTYPEDSRHPIAILSQ